MIEWSIDSRNPQGIDICEQASQEQAISLFHNNYGRALRNISSNSPYTCWGLGRSKIILLAYLIDEKKL